jgi:hypothetical protein
MTCGAGFLVRTWSVVANSMKFSEELSTHSMLHRISWGLLAS